MTENNNMPLRFDGSVWCNLDIALRMVEQHFRKYIRPQGRTLTVIEWYILRALYEQDGQHASALANAVGRAATSFTPNLDRLQEKGFIERRPDESDRRAVRIYLKETALQVRQEVLDSARELDEAMRKLCPPEEFEAFLKVLEALQKLND